MVILMCRRSPARRGLGADAPQVLQRTAELIPNQLKFSALPTLHPLGTSPPTPVWANRFARLAGVAGGRRIPACDRVHRATATGTRSRTGSGGILGVKSSHGGCAAGMSPRSVGGYGFRTGPVSAGNRVEAVHQGHPQHLSRVSDLRTGRLMPPNCGAGSTAWRAWWPAVRGCLSCCPRYRRSRCARYRAPRVPGV